MSLSPRLLPINHGNNFRDLGGYQTKDGRTVASGRLIRSGRLAELDHQDLATLAALPLAYDVDLRSPKEVKDAPDRYPQATHYVFNPVFASDKTRSSKGLDGYGPAADQDPTVGYQHMLGVYADMVEEKSGQAAFKKLFELVMSLPTDAALLFHCTAGKDRTGLSAALLLAALGVDWDTIKADYLYSNIANQQFFAGYLEQIKQSNRPDAFLANFKAVASVNPDYLDRAKATIEKDYGSIDQFLTEVIGLSAGDRRDLQAQFLK